MLLYQHKPMFTYIDHLPTADSIHSIIYAIKIAHLALCLSLLFTAALNSGTRPSSTSLLPPPHHH